MAGFLTSGLPQLAQVAPMMMLNVDTDIPRGTNPQSIAAAAIQVAGVFAECMANQGVSTAGAATQNTLGGVVTTEALTTAPGATYTFTLTNSQITTAYLANGNFPLAAIYSAGNTGGVAFGAMTAMMQLFSTTPTVGQVVWTWTNMGSTALNGTMVVVWHL